MRRCLHCHHDTKHWKPSALTTALRSHPWNGGVITLWPTLMSHPVLDHVMLWFVMVHTGQTIPLITPFQVSQLSPMWALTSPSEPQSALAVCFLDHQETLRRPETPNCCFCAQTKVRALLSATRCRPESVNHSWTKHELLPPQQQSCQGYKDNKNDQVILGKMADTRDYENDIYLSTVCHFIPLTSLARVIVYMHVFLCIYLQYGWVCVSVFTLLDLCICSCVFYSIVFSSFTVSRFSCSIWDQNSNQALIQGHRAKGVNNAVIVYKITTTIYHHKGNKCCTLSSVSCRVWV